VNFCHQLDCSLFVPTNAKTKAEVLDVWEVEEAKGHARAPRTAAPTPTTIHTIL